MFCDYLAKVIDDGIFKCHVKFVGDSRLRIQKDYLQNLQYFCFFGRIVLEEDADNQITVNVIQACLFWV